MLRTLVLAAVMAGFATTSHAFTLLAKRFDGAIRLTVTGTAECEELVPPRNDRGSYYIYDENTDPYLIVLTRFRDDDQADMIILDTSNNNDRNYSLARGYSNYNPQWVGFLLLQGFPLGAGGDYALTQVPATIASNTTFVTLSGTLSDHPMQGCQAEVEATFTRNEEFVEPDGRQARKLMRQLRQFRADAKKKLRN
jgi:hypothetical protein